MDIPKWKDLIGKRLLVLDNKDVLREVTVIEVSPGGKVKFRDFNTDAEEWHGEETWQLLEVL
jgi:hypothetical protein